MAHRSLQYFVSITKRSIIYLPSHIHKHIYVYLISKKKKKSISSTFGVHFYVRMKYPTFDIVDANFGLERMPNINSKFII